MGWTGGSYRKDQAAKTGETTDDKTDQLGRLIKLCANAIKLVQENKRDSTRLLRALQMFKECDGKDSDNILAYLLREIAAETWSYNDHFASSEYRTFIYNCIKKWRNRNTEVVYSGLEEAVFNILDSLIENSFLLKVK